MISKYSIIKFIYFKMEEVKNRESLEMQEVQENCGGVNFREEDLLKTESMDCDNSSNSNLSGSNCNIELNNFTQLNHFSNNFASFPPAKRRRSLHSTFLLLKKRLNLEQFMRKTQIDSLLKKCKSKAFKTIHEALKKCLNVKLPRLPQNFITNIKIDFNKIYLEKTILEIYSEHKIIPSVEEFLSKKYLIEDKLEVFKDFLNLTFKNVFEYYINSKQYVKDYYHIQQREGENFAILFNYISKIFIQYYTKSKGNRPKGVKSGTINRDVEEQDEESSENINDELQGEPGNLHSGETSARDNNFSPPSEGSPINKSEIMKSKNTKKNKNTHSNIKIIQPQPIKRKPVFKRIKVKRVSLKKKIIKVCEGNSGPRIFEIKKHSKKSNH